MAFRSRRRLKLLLLLVVALLLLLLFLAVRLHSSLLFLLHGVELLPVLLLATGCCGSGRMDWVVRRIAHEGIASPNSSLVDSVSHGYSLRRRSSEADGAAWRSLRGVGHHGGGTGWRLIASHGQLLVVQPELHEVGVNPLAWAEELVELPSLSACLDRSHR